MTPWKNYQQQRFLIVIRFSSLSAGELEKQSGVLYNSGYAESSGADTRYDARDGV
jgi:hypothetical protein